VSFVSIAFRYNCSGAKSHVIARPLFFCVPLSLTFSSAAPYFPCFGRHDALSRVIKAIAQLQLLGGGSARKKSVLAPIMFSSCSIYWFRVNAIITA
jgi:hypothetical protein